MPKAFGESLSRRVQAVNGSASAGAVHSSLPATVLP